MFISILNSSFFLQFVLISIDWETNNYIWKLLLVRIQKFLKLSTLALKHTVIGFHPKKHKYSEDLKEIPYSFLVFFLFISDNRKHKSAPYIKNVKF